MAIVTEANTSKRIKTKNWDIHYHEAGSRAILWCSSMAADRAHHPGAITIRTSPGWRRSTACWQSICPAGENRKRSLRPARQQRRPGRISRSARHQPGGFCRQFDGRLILHPPSLRASRAGIAPDHHGFVGGRAGHVRSGRLERRRESAGSGVLQSHAWKPCANLSRAWRSTPAMSPTNCWSSASRRRWRVLIISRDGRAAMASRWSSSTRRNWPRSLRRPC